MRDCVCVFNGGACGCSLACASTRAFGRLVVRSVLIRELDFNVRFAIVEVWRHLSAKRRAIDGSDVQASGRC